MVSNEPSSHARPRQRSLILGLVRPHSHTLSLLRLFAVSAFACGIASCREASAPVSEGVSIIQLVAAPRAWDGRLVRAVGFLRLEFEGDALYLHEQDFRHRLSDNGLAVDIPEDFLRRADLSMNYVLVEGVFRASDPRDAASFAGRITAIRRAELWSSLEDPGARFRANSP